MSLKVGDKEAFYKLIDYLIEKEYPESSVLYQWYMGNKQVADVAVYDFEADQPLAIFEIEVNRLQQKNDAAQRLRTYLSHLDKGVAGYIAFSEDMNGEFIFYKVLPDSIEEIDDIPMFEDLKSSVLSRGTVERRNERKQTIGRLEWICRIGAPLSFVLFFLDIFGIIHITAERLLMVGLVICLLIIPYASKLKILGIEFERLKEKN